jgi:hypothetical protein
MSSSALKLLARSSFALLLVAFGFAQDPTGTLEGQISDPSGAVIRNAEVKINDEATGFSAEQQSSSSGSFRFSFLPVGSYRLTISVPEFSAYTADNIRIDVGRVVNLPVTLTLAGRIDRVNIDAQTASVM